MEEIQQFYALLHPTQPQVRRCRCWPKRRVPAVHVDTYPHCENNIVVGRRRGCARGRRCGQHVFAGALSNWRDCGTRLRGKRLPSVCSTVSVRLTSGTPEELKRFKSELWHLWKQGLCGCISAPGLVYLPLRPRERRLCLAIRGGELGEEIWGWRRNEIANDCLIFFSPHQLYRQVLQFDSAVDRLVAAEATFLSSLDDNYFVFQEVMQAALLALMRDDRLGRRLG